MFVLIRRIGRHVDIETSTSMHLSGGFSIEKIGISPFMPINFLEKHGKFSFIIGHFERWSGTIKTLPHTRMYKYINPLWSHD